MISRRAGVIDLNNLRRRHRGQPELIIISLIDIMMVLLIFLLSTASSSHEVGLKVERPFAAAGAPLDSESMLIGIGAGGQLSFEGKRVERLSLRRLVEERLARRPDLAIILVADKETPAEILVGVMDEAQLGGAKRIAIASRRER
jgi:biopolymer transport protein ExbD